MVFLAKLGVGLLGTALVSGAALSSEGFVNVRVHEQRTDGTHLTIVVPAVLAPAILSLVPRQQVAQASADLRPYMPVIDAAIPVLENCPDGVLVEVTDPGEHVTVAKRHGSIVIDVNDHEDLVHVSVPLRAAHNAIHHIEKANAPM
jgi:hypothetical protein